MNELFTSGSVAWLVGHPLALPGKKDRRPWIVETGRYAVTRD